MATRPAVLFVDPQADRLRDLGARLAAEGYEVVPVGDAARATRFAEGLDQAVIVTSLEALAAGVDLDALLASGGAGRLGQRTVVVMGSHPADEEALPDEISFLPVGGFDLPEIARRLLLVLLGRELGLPADARLSSLVGDLAQTPLIELLRGLAGAKSSGRLDLRGGSLLLQGGEVAAAAAGPVRGTKAFCRLGRLHEGPVRFVPGDFPRGGRSRTASTPWSSPPSRTRWASSRTPASTSKWRSARASSRRRSLLSSSASWAPPSAAPPCGRSSTACRTATARSCRRCCAWKSAACCCAASPE